MTKDMTTGAITPLLVKFTIPLVLGNLFQLTYNAADSIIVGKFVGEEALAAVGTSNPLMTLAICSSTVSAWVQASLSAWRSAQATPGWWSVRSPPPPLQAPSFPWCFR